MNQPQMLEVDPQRIKFNKHNPRKHGGEEYEQLKQSIREIGIIQPPLVRHETGIFYEVIDGEGRVSIAQELELPKISVISLGDISEGQALEMLVTSNMVRTFDFFAQCRGMAEMHRQGMTTDKIAKRLGIPFPGMVDQYLGVGYLPDDLIGQISEDICLSEEKAQIWSNRVLLRSLLPLRQVNPGESKRPRDEHNRPIWRPLDNVYNYDEVRRAIQMVVDGKISSGVEMRAYVAERRRELVEQNFKREVQVRLQDELTRAKEALEEAKSLDIRKAGEKAKQEYQGKIVTLEAELEDVSRELDQAREATASSERDKKVIKKLQLAIDQQKTAESKIKDSIRKEEQRKAEVEYQEWKKKYEIEVKERQEAIKKDLAETKVRLAQEEAEAKERLETYYNNQIAKNKLKAETSYRQLVASASEHLNQSNQSILTLISTGMIHGIEWLSKEELGSLLFTMKATRDTLEEVEQTIQERLGVISSSTSTTIDEQVTNERSMVNHV